MINDLPRFPGVPDSFVAAVNERLRAFRASTGGVPRSHRGTGPSVPPGGGTNTLRLALTNSSGQVGVSFNGTLQASDGTAPYTYLIAAGALPDGLLLNGLTGAITGTPTTAGLYDFTGFVTDSLGNTASASCVINVALPSGASRLIPISTATGRDMGHSTDVAESVSRLVSFRVGVTLTFASVPTQYNTALVSKDNGSNWSSPGWFLFTANGQEIDFLAVRPSTSATWKVAAVPGTLYFDPAVLIPTASLPAGTVISSGFSVAALALPGASDVTSLTVSAVGPDANFPYNQTSGRGNYFSIGSFSYSDSGCISDPNAFFVRLTAQDLDSGHNSIGPEQPFNGTVVGAAAASHSVGPLEGAYGTDGYSYIRSGEIAYVRMRVYLCNRVNQTSYSFADALCATLQTSIGSGDGFVDVPVALTTLDGRRQPRGGIVTRNIEPHDLGNGTQQDPGTGAIVVPNSNAGASYIPDSSFSYSTPGTIGSGGLLPSWGYGLGMTSTVEVRNDGGNSESNYVRLTNGDASISSTISVQPGLQFYIQLAARSSNTAGAAHALGLYVRWQDSSFNWLTPFTTIVGTVSGYVASWTNPAISGYITAPTGAAWGVIQISTSFAEPGYWDVDDVFVQAVIQQTAGGTTASTAQSTGGSGTAVYQATAAVAHAQYGLDYAELVGTGTASQTMHITPNSLVTTMVSGSTGINFITVGRSNATYQIALVVDDSTGPIITVTTGGTTYTGINGTIQDNLGANHTVKCGLIVT